MAARLWSWAIEAFGGEEPTLPWLSDTATGSLISRPTNSKNWAYCQSASQDPLHSDLSTVCVTGSFPVKGAPRLSLRVKIWRNVAAPKPWGKFVVAEIALTSWMAALWVLLPR